MNAPVVNLEAIYAEIFARVVALKTAGTIKGCSRKAVTFAEIEATDKPFIGQQQMDEKDAYQLGSGLATKISGGVYLIVIQDASGDKDFVPATSTNNLLFAIREAFSPIKANGSRASDEQQGRMTLNGLVYDCRVAGDLEADDWTAGADQVSIVPVEFLV